MPQGLARESVRASKLPPDLASPKTRTLSGQGRSPDTQETQIWDIMQQAGLCPLHSSPSAACAHKHEHVHTRVHAVLGMTLY